ncbi:MAG: TonB-dependent receptor, partial [Melioribacteraceae bacterium]
ITKKYQFTFYRINDYIIINKSPSEKEIKKQDYGTITGIVSDIYSGEPLIGASIYFKNTGLGSSSDRNGKFRLSQIPQGKYILKVSFIGYVTREFQIDFTNERIQEYFLELSPASVLTETIVVSDQAFGQISAINRQLKSNTIKNVVSSEKILELPDANAAESVGRLPGISLIRSGGEGNKVVIRGLSPTYNSISIAGVKIPSTDASDRSVDLSIIPSEILSGIEVIKSLTPDIDADALGGAIDFQLSKATPTGFKSQLRLQGGYNNLRDDYGNYEATWTFSNRFLNNKLGLLVAGHIERNQRGFDSFRSLWEMPREKRPNEIFAPMRAAQVDLAYTITNRKKYGFNALLDYNIPNGSLYLTTFFSFRNDKSSVQNVNYYLKDVTIGRHLISSESEIALNSFSFGGKHLLFDFINFDWGGSISNARSAVPFSNSYGFIQPDAYYSENLSQFPTADEIINAPSRDISGFYANSFYRTSSITKDNINSLQFNFELPFSYSKKLSGKIKLGAKTYLNKKERENTSLFRSMYNYSNKGYIKYHSNYGNPDFKFDFVQSNGAPSILNYLDLSFNTGKFLNDQYYFPIGLSEYELNRLMNSYLIDSAMVSQRTADLDDYFVKETINAGYLMTEINYDNFITILSGIRYENTMDRLSGRKGIVPNEIIGYDYNQNPVSISNADRNYFNWFPVIHLRFLPAEWFDLRLVYSKSISRPRMDWLLPNSAINGTNSSVEIGNPDLNPQLSDNYDVFLSFYSNEIGLVTIGGFYKNINNLIYFREGHKILNASKEGFPDNWRGLSLNSPENNPHITKLSGFEFEWQSNLWWLPKPFNGLVINFNYSKIWSKSHYPISYIKNTTLNKFPYLSSVVIDTVREGKMPNQADNILNLSLGYDYSKFSGRISLIYQGLSLYKIGSREELDIFTSPSTRIDLSIKYQLLPYIGIYFDINNLLNTPDKAYQQAEKFPNTLQYFGRIIDLGIVLEL